MRKSQGKTSHIGTASHAGERISGVASSRNQQTENRHKHRRGFEIQTSPENVYQRAPSLRNTTIQKLLVVDPDANFSSTVADYLTLFGFEVSHKNNLVGALDYVKHHPCDLIFLSDNFDQIHPITSLRKFQEISDSRLVVIATRGDDQLAVELMKAGASDYLSRRVKDKDILASLASLLDRLGNQTEKTPNEPANKFQSPNNTHSPYTNEFKPVSKPEDKLAERLVRFYEGVSQNENQRYDTEIAEFESIRAGITDETNRNDSRSHDFDKPDLDKPDFNRLDSNRPDFSRSDFNRAEFNRSEFNRSELKRPEFSRTQINEKDCEKVDVFERLSLESGFNSSETPPKKTKLQSTQQNGIANIADLPGNLISLEQNLNIDVINHSASKIIGFSTGDGIKKSIIEFIPPSLQKSFQQELDKIAEDCHVVGNNDSGSQKLFETVFIVKDGETIPVNCHLSCIESGGSNFKRSHFNTAKFDGEREIRYLLSFDDISEVKSAQAKQQYQAMWNNILHSYSYRFINFKLADFPTELTAIISETANFFKLDRISIYLFDRTSSSAKIYLEWLKSDCLSLKQFSKKIELKMDALEFSRLNNAEVQLLTPEETIEQSSDLSCFGLSEHYAQVGSRSSVILPLERHTSNASNRVMGWLSLDLQSSTNRWLEEDLMLIAPLGRLISEAFARRAQEEHRRVTHQKLSENHGRLSEQAFTDGLTSLANRRYFDKVLESEVRRASREQSNIAVLFCDVDYFKAYNDTYGHLEGDICLKAIAKVLKNEFQRASDFVARFGGEEFAVVLSGMSNDDAKDAADKLIRKIIEQNILHHGSPIGQIAISVGIACASAPNPGDAGKILAKADKALYKAKSNGRNRVEMVSYSPN